MAEQAFQWWRNGDHPDDRVGQTEYDVVTGEPYIRQEGAVVRYFRHPDIPGATLHETCGFTFHEHGWIDEDEIGLIVCPGYWVVTGSDGMHYVQEAPTRG